MEAQNQSENSILLYLQKRNSAFKVFEMPVQLYFNGVTCIELHQFIGNHFGVPLEQLEMYKYVKHNNTWQIIKEQDGKTDQNVPDSTHSKRDKDTHKANSTVKNVRSKPFNLRDGGNVTPLSNHGIDIIVVKNKLDDPENKDQLNLAKLTNAQQSSKPPKAKNQRTRAPEAKLVIYV